ncbi:unnamed protein product [Prorocentrum cordatum]|uniref:Uncharacterized protein n=1 Tax=Prorocentrum cordatum TaxID=2364126 RepID=A0ABN9Y846_9DINO|nr:unnamed protein product [Polarella glacialis]
MLLSLKVFGTSKDLEGAKKLVAGLEGTGGASRAATWAGIRSAEVSVLQRLDFRTCVPTSRDLLDRLLRDLEEPRAARAAAGSLAGLAGFLLELGTVHDPAAVYGPGRPPAAAALAALLLALCATGERRQGLQALRSHARLLDAAGPAVADIGEALWRRWAREAQRGAELARRGEAPPTVLEKWRRRLGGSLGVAPPPPAELRCLTSAVCQEPREALKGEARHPEADAPPAQRGEGPPSHDQRVLAALPTPARRLCRQRSDPEASRGGPPAPPGPPAGGGAEAARALPPRLRSDDATMLKESYRRHGTGPRFMNLQDEDAAEIRWSRRLGRAVRAGRAALGAGRAGVNRGRSGRCVRGAESLRAPMPPLPRGPAGRPVLGAGAARCSARTEPRLPEIRGRSLGGAREGPRCWFPPDPTKDHGRQGRLWQRLEETERSEGMGARLKGRVQAAVRQVSENLSMPRGPLTGSTPPPKSRKKEEDDMDDVGPEMSKLAGVLTRRLGDMIAEKFEERDLRLRAVEEKVEGVAKATDEAIGSLEDKLEALHKEVEELKSKGGEEGIGRVDEELRKKITDMETNLHKIKKEHTNRKVAILGGFGQGTSFQEAKDSIAVHLNKVGLKVPADMYYKGERVPLGFLVGVKKLLVSWNFSKKAIKVDEEEMVMSVGGTDVLQAVVEHNVLTMKWLASDWEKWSDFTDAGELAELIAKAGERLTNFGEGGAKGFLEHTGRTARIKMNVRGGAIGICTAYAPHNEKPPEEKFAFYENLDDLCDKCSVSGQRLLLGDMSARLGQRRQGEEDVLGTHTWGREAVKKVEPPNRDLLVEFCLERDLMVGNTYVEGMPEEKATFVESGAGHMSEVTERTHNMLDLALVESGFASDAQDIRGHREAGIQSNHFLVSCSIRRCFEAPPKQVTKRKDRSALTLPGAARKFTQTFKDMAPQTRGSESVDDARAGMVGAFEVSGGAVPEKYRISRRPWISQCTLDLIDQRSQARLENDQVKQRDLRRKVRRSAKADKTMWLNDCIQTGTWDGLKLIRKTRRRSARGLAGQPLRAMVAPRATREGAGQRAGLAGLAGIAKRERLRYSMNAMVDTPAGAAVDARAELGAAAARSCAALADKREAYLRSTYERQLAEPGYAQLVNSSVPIVGTWDDHDYGVNDGDKSFDGKRWSQVDWQAGTLAVKIFDAEPEPKLHRIFKLSEIARAARAALLERQAAQLTRQLLRKREAEIEQRLSQDSVTSRANHERILQRLAEEAHGKETEGVVAREVSRQICAGMQMRQRLREEKGGQRRAEEAERDKWKQARSLYEKMSLEGRLRERERANQEQGRPGPGQAEGARGEGQGGGQAGVREEADLAGAPHGAGRQGGAAPAGRDARAAREDPGGRSAMAKRQGEVEQRRKQLEEERHAGPPGARGRSASSSSGPPRGRPTRSGSPAC